MTWWATLIWNYKLVIPKLYAISTSASSQHADRCATKYLPSRVTVQAVFTRFSERVQFDIIFDVNSAFNSTGISEPQPCCILMTYSYSAE